jgi:8-amino-7-oxononanoate synthase
MNVSLMSVLASRNDAIIVDRLVHNSLMRGALASGATMFRFKHNSVADAAACMEKARRQVTGNLVLVTESVFSMDGDCAPLKALSTLCESYQALFVVDEAHAFGVLGAEGRGLLASEPHAQAHVILGTFGKSFGTSGAFAAVPELLKTVLINEAEGFIYSTGIAPFLAGATLEALRWVKIADEKRAHIAAQAGTIRKAFGIETTVQTPIIPVIIGSDSALETVKTSLLDAGIVTGFIRPPTVPENTARLRISIHAFNTAEDVSNLIQTVKTTLS